jgi:hypothetical protein
MSAQQNPAMEGLMQVEKLRVPMSESEIISALIYKFRP